MELKKIAIVGTTGQMGGLFARELVRTGRTVAELNRPYDDALVAEALDGCDLIFLSVPVTAMDAVLKVVAPHLKTPTILSDFGSVKTLPLRCMMEAYDGPVVGTHPLFGPVIPEGFEPKVAVAPGRESDAEAAGSVCRLMEDCGYTAFLTTAERHDRAMAHVQGLNFTSTVAFLAAMRDVEDIENFLTPSFQRRLDAARKMLTQDTELFEIISGANPYLHETTRQFRTYLSVAAGGDLDLLAERARWWWRNEQE